MALVLSKFDLTKRKRDAEFAVFDKSAKYIFFTASTNIGPTIGGLDMSSDGKQVTRSAYIIVLRKDLPSPLAPESDEEKADSEKKDTDNSKDWAVPRNREREADLFAGKSGESFVLDTLHLAQERVLQNVLRIEDWTLTPGEKDFRKPVTTVGARRITPLTRPSWTVRCYQNPVVPYKVYGQYGTLT
jgi:hypothetical protein